MACALLLPSRFAILSTTAGCFVITPSGHSVVAQREAVEALVVPEIPEHRLDRGKPLSLSAVRHVTVSMKAINGV